MKCDKCGAKLADGARFCGECGEKITPKARGVDWEGKFVSEDASVLLTDEQVSGIRSVLKEAKKKAGENRVLLPEDSGYGSRFKNFKELYGKRIGMDADVLPFLSEEMVVGFLVNGKEGSGERGTVFTKMGILIIDKDFPCNDGKGDPIGALVPWKVFYLFGERIEGDLAEKAYRLMKPAIMLKSDLVDDDVKQGLREDMDRENGSKGVLLRFDNTGLNASQIEDMMEDIKEWLNLDRIQDGEEDDEAEFGAEMDEEDEGLEEED